MLHLTPAGQVRVLESRNPESTFLYFTTFAAPRRAFCTFPMGFHCIIAARGLPGPQPWSDGHRPTDISGRRAQVDGHRSTDISDRRTFRTGRRTLRTGRRTFRTGRRTGRRTLHLSSTSQVCATFSLAVAAGACRVGHLIPQPVQNPFKTLSNSAAGGRLGLRSRGVVETFRAEIARQTC